MVPEAFFDCLQITSELGDSLGGVSRMDFQRLTYLSCLLSIYQAKPVADWGYKFANTGAGTPFSDEINDAVAFLARTSQIVECDGRFMLTESGKRMLETLRGFSSNDGRFACLNAACSSMLAVPLATITQGLDQEPTVMASHQRAHSTMLLEEPHLQLLHEHFNVLSQVIEPNKADLFSPSVLWLSYVSDTAVSERTCITTSSVSEVRI